MMQIQQPSTFDDVLTALRKLAATPLAAATAPPKAIYTLPEMPAHEMDRIFATEWLCAGRADEVPNPGDFMTFECGDQPLKPAMLMQTLISYDDGSRSRQQCATALGALARHLELPLPEDWRQEAGGYGLHRARFRQ